MSVLDLFSGIGGFSLGLKWAGFETKAFCEIDPYCQKVLKKHWPHVIIHDDIKNLSGDKYRGTIDIITGGYPCQPFSVAGKQRGVEDARHLWPEMLRVIREVKPRWVICENVPGHIKLGLDTVITQLEAENYTVWTFLIPACAIGAPHKRERIWIIANAKHNGSFAMSQQGGNGQNVRWSKERTDKPVKFEGIHKPSNVAHPTCEGLEIREGISSDIGEELTTSTGMGWWDIEPDVGRVANGIPDRVDRIKGLGNAIVPQMAYFIGVAIKQYEGKML